MNLRTSLFLGPSEATALSRTVLSVSTEAGDESKVIADWLIYIQPSKPQQNADVERCNRTICAEWLGRYHFKSTEEVRDHVARWLWTYNNDGPNTGRGGMAPMQKLKAA